MLKNRLQATIYKLRKFAQNSEVLDEPYKNENNVWESLSEQFRSWLQKSGLQNIETRLNRPWSDPKAQKAINIVKQKIHSELQKIEENFPGLAEAAERLTASPEMYSYDDTRTWNSGQHFTERAQDMKGTEKVIAIYFTPDRYREMEQDPVMANFLAEKSGHFSSIVEPLGWALVYIDPNNQFAAINQIQTDILNKYKAYLQDIKIGENDSIDMNELTIRLKANRLEQIIDPKVQEEMNSEFYDLLMENPHLIAELHHMPTSTVEDIIENKDSIFKSIKADSKKAKEQEFATKDLQSYIAHKLRDLIKNWPKIVLQAVKDKVKQLGITDVYMNTSQTVSGGAGETKREYFYEQLPREMGFKKKDIDIGRGPERLWHTKWARLRRACRQLRSQLKRNLRT